MGYSPDTVAREPDASRNAARLLAATREVPAEAGSDAASDVIAGHAGVVPGRNGPPSPPPTCSRRPAVSR